MQNILRRMGNPQAPAVNDRDNYRRAGNQQLSEWFCSGGNRPESLHCQARTGWRQTLWHHIRPYPPPFTAPHYPQTSKAARNAAGNTAMPENGGLNVEKLPVVGGVDDYYGGGRAEYAGQKTREINHV